VTIKRNRRGRLRVALKAPAGPVEHRMRVTVNTNEGRVSGILVGWKAAFHFRGHVADVAVTDYALDPGELGYVSRPGMGGYEALSVTSGTGSDISARIRVRAGSHARLVLYAGRPRPGSPHVYGMFSISL